MGIEGVIEGVIGMFTATIVITVSRVIGGILALLPLL
jgi:hypothetical protein